MVRENELQLIGGTFQVTDLDGEPLVTSKAATETSINPAEDSPEKTTTAASELLDSAEKQPALNT